MSEACWIAGHSKILEESTLLVTDVVSFKMYWALSSCLKSCPPFAELRGWRKAIGCSTMSILRENKTSSSNWRGISTLSLVSPIIILSTQDAVKSQVPFLFIYIFNNLPALKRFHKFLKIIQVFLKYFMFWALCNQRFNLDWLSSILAQNEVTPWQTIQCTDRLISPWSLLQRAFE